ncbi:uncharacterized protein TNCV_5017821 [Trichonephila clavipes]|nr:uncharacterized protein TNCV_5017821 [Trichonephila clavipes]
MSAEELLCQPPWAVVADGAALKLLSSVIRGWKNEFIYDRQSSRVARDKPWSTLCKKSHGIPSSPRAAAVAKFRLLTGHDCLCAHLFRFNLVTSPICVLCDTGQDMTAAHLDECSALNDLNCIVKRNWCSKTEQDFSGHLTKPNRRGELENRLSVRPNRPSLLPVLTSAVMDIWKFIPMATYRKLVKGLPRRVQAVIDAEGRSTSN